MQILKKIDNLNIADEEDHQEATKNPGNDPNSALELKKKIKKHLKILALLMEDTPHLAVSKPKTMLQRDIICKEFEKLMEHEDYKQEALDHLWRFCWYEPIKVCLAHCSNHSVGAREHLKWLKTFINCGIGQLSALLEKHPDLHFAIFIYLGDLHRYSHANCSSYMDELELKCSKHSYLKALQANPASGRSFNQMALLCQEERAFESIRLFLRALMVKQAYSRAMDNIKRMDQIKFEGDGQKVVFGIVKNVLLEFNRQNFEKMSSEFEKSLDDVIKDDLMEGFRQVQCLSLMATSVFKSDALDETQLRYIGSLVCRSLHTILEEAQKTLIAQSETSHSDNGNSSQVGQQSPCVLFNIHIAVAEFLSEASQKFVARKIPVALKIQYKNVVQNLVTILNHPSVLPTIISSLNSDANPKQGSVEQWLVEGSATPSNQLDILVHYIQACLTNPSTPISFDQKVFKAMNSSATDKDLGFLHKVSQIHQQHFQQQQDKDSKMPVYVMPHHKVLLTKVAVLQNLIKSTKLTVIIQPSVLSQLDRLKKESQQAREAIRWLEANIPKARVRMSSISGGGGLELETEKFLAEKNLLERQTLFAVILVVEKSPEAASAPVKISQKPAIAVEDINAFFTRMVSYVDNYQK